MALIEQARERRQRFATLWRFKRIQMLWLLSKWQRGALTTELFWMTHQSMNSSRLNAITSLYVLFYISLPHNREIAVKGKLPVPVPVTIDYDYSTKDVCQYVLSCPKL